MSEIVTIKNKSKDMAVAHYGEPAGYREEVDAGATINVSGEAAKYLLVKYPAIWEVSGKKSTGKTTKSESTDKE